MRNSPENAGAFLRRMRKARRLTLKQVELCSLRSTSVLSRLERNERSVSRDDCLVLSKCLRLTSYETHSLFFMAGYLPEAQHAHSDAELRKTALGLLGDFRFPAVLMDTAGYLYAWNSVIEAVVRPAHDRPVHVLDDLFSPRLRAKLGEQWRHSVTRAIWIFLQRFVATGNEQAYAAALQHMERTHGVESIALLNEAQKMEAPDSAGVAQLGLLFEHDSSLGPVRYISAQLLPHTNAGLELHMFLPIDADNTRRFDLFSASLGANTIYLGRSPWAEQDADGAGPG